jgi:DinB family protein
MPRVKDRARSARATALAARLDEAVAGLIAVIAQIEPDRWQHIPAPGVWAIGKDVEHVIEAAGYHQWIVRLTIGQKVSSRRPILERERLTTDLTPREAVSLLGQGTKEGAELLLGLSDEQLNLPTRPPRARFQALSETIELVLIGHYDAHRGDIEGKIRAPWTRSNPRLE